MSGDDTGLVVVVLFHEAPSGQETNLGVPATRALSLGQPVWCAPTAHKPAVSRGGHDSTAWRSQARFRPARACEAASRMTHSRSGPSRVPFAGQQPPYPWACPRVALSWAACTAVCARTPPCVGAGHSVALRLACVEHRGLARSAVDRCGADLQDNARDHHGRRRWQCYLLRRVAGTARQSRTGAQMTAASACVSQITLPTVALRPIDHADGRGAQGCTVGGPP